MEYKTSPGNGTISIDGKPARRAETRTIPRRAVNFRTDEMVRIRDRAELASIKHRRTEERYIQVPPEQMPLYAEAKRLVSWAARENGIPEPDILPFLPLNEYRTRPKALKYFTRWGRFIDQDTGEETLIEAKGMAGFVERGGKYIAVDAGLDRKNLAYIVGHEVRHLAQPKDWSSGVREVDAEKYGKRFSKEAIC